MLLVKTRLGQSKISGIGLFADQFISKGAIIWKYTEGVDLKLSDEQLAELEKEYPLDNLKKYLYRSKSSHLHILCGDDGRFINHSFQPNTSDTSEDDEGFTIAASDIQPGEEITSDYNGFDKDFDDYKGMLK
ncbi:SET domain-containing protein [Adhaeribacter soli]|uniref:SET domain-containing protein n=1 Tax=Adhaeribacter soli TaxID=2607655 RepID=A0A5N1J0H2_9BACT|nr:SET domain-containing protein [Adhaeribacter soli]KAA9339984.1 SET domain-containing protein [Adhaeribacter soli]